MTKSTSTTKEDYGPPGIIILFSRGYIKSHTSKSFKKMKKKWTGWKPTKEEQLMLFTRDMMGNEGNKEEDLSTAQKNIENAARNIQHRTKAHKENELMGAPERVRLREEAAARCAEKIKWRAPRRQARKASAEHLVRCSLEPGKKKAKRKPLTELYVSGHFAEDRAEWQEKLQRHCEEVYTGMKEV